MQTLKLAKNRFVYLFLLIVAPVTTSILLVKDLHQVSSDSKTTTQIVTRQNNFSVLTSPQSTGSCTLPNVYTSLPAKCRATDGKFIKGRNWNWPNIIVV